MPRHDRNCRNACLKVFLFFLCFATTGTCLGQGQNVVPHQDLVLVGKNAGEIREFCSAVKMEFSWCPSGKFEMGSPESEADRDSDEDQVNVTVKNGFWMSRTEITQRQWTSIMQSKPWGGIKGDPDISDIPATGVSYADAKRFCAQLTRKERKRRTISDEFAFFVPTEAQWEYACRAGSETAFCFGDKAEELDQYAWFLGSYADGGNKVFRAERVAQLRPNAWGLFDMHGNVEEWCADVYDVELPGGVDPFRRRNRRYAVEELQVVRGGHWDCSARQCRSSRRSFNSQDACCELVGFRVVLCGLRHPPKDLLKPSPRRTGDKASPKTLKNLEKP